MDQEKEKHPWAHAQGKIIESEPQPQLVEQSEEQVQSPVPTQSQQPTSHTAQPPSKPQPFQDSQPPKAKKKLPWLFILVCGVLAVINCAVYVNWFPKPALPDPKAAAKMTQAQQLIGLHKYPQAIALLEEGKNRTTGSGLELLLELAYAYMLDGKQDKAVEICRYAACNKATGEIFALHKVATRLFKEQKYDEAFKLSDYAISFNASQSEPEYLVLARDHLVRAGCRALKFNESQKLADLDLSLADYKSAAEIYRTKGPSDPDYPRAQYQVAETEKLKKEMLKPKPKPWRLWTF